jgi:hypothetical protein
MRTVAIPSSSTVCVPSAITGNRFRPAEPPAALRDRCASPYRACCRCLNRAVTQPAFRREREGFSLSAKKCGVQDPSGIAISKLNVPYSSSPLV